MAHARPARGLVAPGFVAAIFATASATLAQCAPYWLPGASAPGVRGTVYATATWDPDGPGPLGPRWVLGGQFDTALPNVGNLVAFDPVSRTWSGFGNGLLGTVRALATLPNGELVIGGEFTNSYGVGANGVARWDGTAWHALGAGTNGPVHALAVMSNGDLFAGGSFTTAGGANTPYLARWDGVAWQSPGVTPTTAVRALLAPPGGDLIAGSDRVQRWNGASWQTLGVAITVWTPFPNQPGVVSALAAMPNGDVVATGTFDQVQGVVATNIARWNGASWQPIGGGIGSPRASFGGNALSVLPNGDLVVGGLFATAGGAPVDSLARWDGAGWSAFGTSANNTQIWALSPLPGGQLLVGGRFPAIGGIAADNVAQWDGASWHTFGAGLNGNVHAFAQLPGGELVIGGDFTNLGGLQADRIARWNGASWQPLAAGFDDAVLALAVLPNGELVAGGRFHASGGAPIERVARWDGAAWQPLGAGLGNEVLALTVGVGGELYAGGYFQYSGPTAISRVARWDGTAWQPIGSGTTYVVMALAARPNGELVAGGYFTHAGGVLCNGIARWDGSAWQPFGTGVDGLVEDFAQLANGDLVAAGTFTTAGGVPARNIARWDGAAWHPLGAGIAGSTVPTIASCLRVLANGDLVAGGEFATAGGAPANCLARWNGSTWQPLAGGTNRWVHALLQLSDGDLAVGGVFTSAGGGPTAGFARLTTPCPATATPLPTPCLGPAGPLTLAAGGLPWTGSTFRATATGFAGNALGVCVLGFTSPGSPLAQVLPLALPNCALLASGDAIVLTLPVAGVSGYQFALPNDAAFAGLPLFQQFLQVAVDAQGYVASSSASNGLALVVGTF